MTSLGQFWPYWTLLRLAPAHLSAGPCWSTRIVFFKSWQPARDTIPNLSPIILCDTGSSFTRKGMCSSGIVCTKHTDPFNFLIIPHPMLRNSRWGSRPSLPSPGEIHMVALHGPCAKMFPDSRKTSRLQQKLSVNLPWWQSVFHLQGFFLDYFIIIHLLKIYILTYIFLHMQGIHLVQFAAELEGPLVLSSRAVCMFFFPGNAETPTFGLISPSCLIGTI